MKRNKSFFVFVILSLINLFGCNQISESNSSSKSEFESLPASTNSSTLNQDESIFTSKQSVLLIGQSNMAGRGNIADVEAISDDRITMLRDGKWQKMVEPIHNDKPAAGIGLAASFAKGFVEKFNCEIGLIPGAFGGTSLSQWSVGSSYYSRALEMAKDAQKDSDICAILWHQGESNQNNSAGYADKLENILNGFINDLSLDKEKLVIITGELGEFRADTKDAIHTELHKLENVYKNYGVASSKGLTAQDVTTHFDAASLRVFGYRYFDIFYNLITGKHFEYNDDPSFYFVGGKHDEEEIDPSLYRIEGTIVEDTYISSANQSSKDVNYSQNTNIGTFKNTSRPFFKFSFENILSFGDFQNYKDQATIEFKFYFSSGASILADNITCNAYGFLPSPNVSSVDFSTITWNSCSSTGINSYLYRGNASFIFKDTSLGVCEYIYKAESYIKYSFSFKDIEKYINLENGDNYGYAIFGFDFNVGGVNFASMENTIYGIPTLDFVYKKNN